MFFPVTTRPRLIRGGVFVFINTHATMIKLSNLHPNTGQLVNAENPNESVPGNPRNITEDEFAKLKKSLRNFRKMLTARPIVVDENGIILGGNMRYQALCRLRDEHAVVGSFHFTDEIPDEWVKQIFDWSARDKREFIIKDNQERGENDIDKLANEWNDDELIEWDVDGVDWGQTKDGDDTSAASEKPECEFAEVLNEANNYIVLQFTNEIDWLQAQTVFGLETRMCGSTLKSGEITNGMRRFGVARVLNGAKALDKLTKI